MVIRNTILLHYSSNVADDCFPLIQSIWHRQQLSNYILSKPHSFYLRGDNYIWNADIPLFRSLPGTVDGFFNVAIWNIAWNVYSPWIAMNHSTYKSAWRRFILEVFAQFVAVDDITVYHWMDSFTTAENRSNTCSSFRISHFNLSKQLVHWSV